MHSISQRKTKIVRIVRTGIESVRNIEKIVRWWYDEDTKGRRDAHMSITATELKSNLGKYLILARTEDIYITRNGKIVAKLSNPQQDKIDLAKSLFGVLPADMTLEEARKERLDQI